MIDVCSLVILKSIRVEERDMTGFKIPIFSKGNLLSQEMLEAIKDFEIQFAQNMYSGYTDGIVTGTKVYVEQGSIYIGQGIIKYQNRLFFISENTRVAVGPADDWQAIKLVFSDVEKTRNFEKQEMTIEVSRNLMKERNKIEICRVKLQNGAHLRSEYRNLEDMNTMFDTINVIEAQWAAYGKDSINPQILQEFAQEARKGSITNPQDISFVQQILNNKGQAIDRDLIQFYLDNRLEKKAEEYTNQEIYQGLCKVLRQMRTGVEHTQEIRRPRRMIVD